MYMSLDQNTPHPQLYWFCSFIQGWTVAATGRVPKGMVMATRMGMAMAKAIHMAMVTPMHQRKSSMLMSMVPKLLRNRSCRVSWLCVRVWDVGEGFW